MGECTKCGNECNCKLPASDPTAPQYAFSASSFVWNGPDISCGSNQIVQYGQSLLSGFQNLAAYVCQLQLTPGPQGPPGATGPQGPPGSNPQVKVQNTLYVSVDGTSSGERTNFGAHYQTLRQVFLAANAGDCVYVYPGSYYENQEWIKSGVSYFFYPGTFVVSNGEPITDSGTPKSILIYGYGSFSSSLSNGIAMYDENSTMYVRALEIYGSNNGISILNGVYDIEVDTIGHSFQYNVTIRGKAQGRIKARQYNAAGYYNGSSILIRNHGYDEVKRVLIFEGDLLTTNTMSYLGSVSMFDGGSNTIIDFRIKRIENFNSTAGDSIFGIYTGKLKGKSLFVNANGSVILNNSVSTLVEFHNCSFKAPYGLHRSTGGTSLFKNCIGVFDSDTQNPIYLSDLAKHYTVDCQFKDVAVGGNPFYMIASDTVYLVLNGNTYGINNFVPLCVDSMVPVNIRVVKECRTSAAVFGVNVTNLCSTTVVSDLQTVVYDNLIEV